jgi:hypothetical protein
MLDSPSAPDRLLINSSLSTPDLTYAALYSKRLEVDVYALPITLLLSAASGWLVYKSGASTHTPLRVMGFILVIGPWVKLLIIFSCLTYPAYKAWLLAGTWPGLSATHHLFTSDGIDITRRNGATLLPWKEISKVVETKKGFLFYRDGKVTTFVPLRRLEGPEEIRLVRMFIERYVDSARPIDLKPAT